MWKYLQFPTLFFNIQFLMFRFWISVSAKIPDYICDSKRVVGVEPLESHLLILNNSLSNYVVLCDVMSKSCNNIVCRKERKVLKGKTDVVNKLS